MNMSCSKPAKDCLHELSTVLAQNHFEVSPSEDGALSVIFGGERLCRIVDGKVDSMTAAPRPRAAVWHSRRGRRESTEAR